jgi:hypothetical protein
MPSELLSHNRPDLGNKIISYPHRSISFLKILANEEIFSPDCQESPLGGL